MSVTGVLLAMNSILIATNAGIINSSPNSFSTQMLSDFSNHTFLLYEGKGTYEIRDADGVFIEGSNDTNSPYYRVDGSLYYLGPGNYYYSVNPGTIIDLMTGETRDSKEYEGLQCFQPSIEFKNEVAAYSSKSSGTSSALEVDSNGFSVIKEADYFRKLKYFPMNFKGECGIVALSILLGFYDTFYNDDFIPNGLRYHTSIVDSENQTHITGEEELIHKVNIPHALASKMPVEKWSEVPGTNYSMHDYLFDKYMHTFVVADPSLGYPMMDGELKNTFQDYVNDNCSYLSKYIKINSGHIWYTWTRAIEQIESGNPVCLVLQSYKYADSTVQSKNMSLSKESSEIDGKNHDVIAYGYKRDKDGNEIFLTHFGWNPGSTRNAQIAINATHLYGYFSISFDNAHHKCSRNVTMNADYNEYAICGCGRVW